MTLRFAAVTGHCFYVEFRSIKAIQYLPLKLQTPTPTKPITVPELPFENEQCQGAKIFRR